MNARENFLLFNVLKACLILAIVGLWTLRNDRAVERHEPQATAFSAPVLTHAAPPMLDLERAVMVGERFERAERSPRWPFAEEVDFWDAAHLFRRDPLDRRAETRSTFGHDYFLEGDYLEDQAIELRLSQPSCWAGGEDGNRRAYVVHGDLWVHSHRALEVWLGDAQTEVTFVVYGDVHFQDDFRTEGAVDFVALRDEQGRGGDIHLGDPDYLTLQAIDARLYAEGDLIAGDADSAVRMRALSVGGRITLEGIRLEIR